jgi:diamine N-acetyltransferase
LITTRCATHRDAALLAELGARTFSDAFAADNTPEDMAAYLTGSFSPEKQAGELADPRSLFLIAEIENTAAGYAHLHAGQWPREVAGTHPIELMRLYSTRQWIGRGVGTELMKACLHAARNRGADIVWLGVWENNLRAQAFYRKWGFVDVGRHVFMLGSDAQTDLVMQKVVA